MKNVPINVVDGMPEIPKNSWHNQFNDPDTIADNPHRPLTRQRVEKEKPKKQEKKRF